MEQPQSRLHGGSDRRGLGDPKPQPQQRASGHLGPEPHDEVEQGRAGAVEGEAGVPMAPPTARTWSRRGRTPVVQVRDCSRRRISPRPGRHPIREVPCPRHCSCRGQGTSRTCARRSVQVAERTASARAGWSGASPSGRSSPKSRARQSANRAGFRAGQRPLLQAAAAPRQLECAPSVPGKQRDAGCMPLPSGVLQLSHSGPRTQPWPAGGAPTPRPGSPRTAGTDRHPKGGRVRRRGSGCRYGPGALRVNMRDCSPQGPWIHHRNYLEFCSGLAYEQFFVNALPEAPHFTPWRSPERLTL